MSSPENARQLLTVLVAAANEIDKLRVTNMELNRLLEDERSGRAALRPTPPSDMVTAGSASSGGGSASVYPTIC